MILFFKRDTGDVFGVLDGRVHGEEHLKCHINDGTAEDNIGKYVIGWIESKNGRIAYNTDKFELLQEFESISPISPLDYKVDIETGELIKK